MPASALLPGVLGAAVHGIDFKKRMRWGDVEQSFARPVQWLLALHGQEVVPVVFADVKSGRMTFGHRFLSPGPHPVGRPRDYAGLLERAHVLAAVEARKERIRTEVSAAAARAGGPRPRGPGAPRPGHRAGGVAQPRCSAASRSATWTSRPRCWSRR